MSLENILASLVIFVEVNVHEQVLYILLIEEMSQFLVLLSFHDAFSIQVGHVDHLELIGLSQKLSEQGFLVTNIKVVFLQVQNQHCLALDFLLEVLFGDDLPILLNLLSQVQLLHIFIREFELAELLLIESGLSLFNEKERIVALLFVHRNVNEFVALILLHHQVELFDCRGV